MISKLNPACMFLHAGGSTAAADAESKAVCLDVPSLLRQCRHHGPLAKRDNKILG